MEFKIKHNILSTDFIMVDFYRYGKEICHYNGLKRSEASKNYTIGFWHIKLKPNVKHGFYFKGLSKE